MQIWWLLCEIRDCLTDLRVGALDVDGLQINMEADYKGVPSFRAALQLMGCDGQCGGTAHRLQKAQASLLSQQCVHTELTQANCPWEGITWWEKREGRLKTKQKKHTHTHTKSNFCKLDPCHIPILMERRFWVWPVKLDIKVFCELIIQIQSDGSTSVWVGSSMLLLRNTNPDWSLIVWTVCFKDVIWKTNQPAVWTKP